jgi:peptidoglycan/LPS O-acetylase OafA/YrhL
MIEPSDRPRVDALSGLRLMAITLVVLFHLGDAAFDGAPAPFEAVRQHANIVMPLFFVLSGFVLTYSYRDPIASGTLGRNTFLVSRFARLWPVYVLALALRFTIDATVNKGVPLAYAAGALSQGLMLQGFTPPLVWFGNAPGWTVCVEAFFYVLFPWLTVRLAHLGPRRAIALGAGLWIAGQLVPVAYVLERPDGWPPPGEPQQVFLDLLRFFPLFRLPSFIIGILTANIFMRGAPGPARQGGAALAFVGLVPIAFTFGGGLELLGRHGFGLLSWPFPFTHNGLLAPAWALVVLGLARGCTVARWLSSRPLVRLGDASYALYILHFPLFDAVALWLVPEWDKTPLFLAQLFALMLPVSVLSYERFEQPVRRALLRHWRVWAGGAGAATESMAAPPPASP